MNREILLKKLALIVLVGLFLSASALANKQRGHDHEQEFIPNPSCTIGDSWDPDTDRPSHAARRQLAPSDEILRIGVVTTNKAIAWPYGSILVGPAIDISCRLAVKLGLPIEFHTYNQGTYLAGFRAGEYDIGFSFDPTLAPSDVAVANPYVGVENTYFVLVDSAFQSVSDVDKPGILIGVPGGSSPDVYLTMHLQFATLVRYVDTATALNALKAGQVDAAATGRSAGGTFPDPAYRALPDDIFIALLGPFMHVNETAGVCYLRDYVEASKKSGLIQQAITRITSPPFPFLPGLMIPGPMTTCEHDNERDDKSDGERRLRR